MAAIWVYGVLIIAGVVGYFVWRPWMKLNPIPVDVVLSSVLIGTPVVMLTCHLVYFVVAGMPAAAWRAFFLTAHGWRAGYTSFGVPIGIVPVLIVVSLIHRYPLLRLLDHFGPVSFIISAIWRGNCFLHGCCYGAPTSLPWGVRFPIVRELHLMTPPSHPVQLYEAGLSVLVLLLLPSLFRRLRTRPGEGVMVLLCVVVYSAERFVLEFFRIGGTSRVAAYGMSMTQIVTLGSMLVFGCWLAAALASRNRGISESRNGGV
jgi:phosphatidylglycerol:prolipoprotein diacylglycerol transferase